MRKTFEELSSKELSFVARVNPSIRYEVVKPAEIASKHTEKLTIEEDVVVRLFNKQGAKTSHFLRLIKTTNKESGNPFYFLTNLRIFHQRTNNGYLQKKVGNRSVL